MIQIKIVRRPLGLAGPQLDQTIQDLCLNLSADNWSLITTFTQGEELVLIFRQ
jgi:hypothetical protein